MLSDTWLAPWLGWGLVVVLAGAHLTSSLVTRRMRVAAQLAVPSTVWVLARSAGLTVLLAVGVIVLNPRGPAHAGDLRRAGGAARPRTAPHGVGQADVRRRGNAEASRRAGINVTQVRILAFVGASTLAAVGGVLAASRLAAVKQTSGGSDILLNAIATAVIGGTSLFGGRGRAYAALLGRLGRQVGQRVIARKPGEPDDPVGEEAHVVDRRDPRWLNAQ